MNPFELLSNLQEDDDDDILDIENIFKDDFSKDKMEEIVLNKPIRTKIGKIQITKELLSSQYLVVQF